MSGELAKKGALATLWGEKPLTERSIVELCEGWKLSDLLCDVEGIALRGQETARKRAVKRMNRRRRDIARELGRRWREVDRLPESKDDYRALLELLDDWLCEEAEFNGFDPSPASAMISLLRPAFWTLPGKEG
jgi:hypothetical protein